MATAYYQTAGRDMSVGTVLSRAFGAIRAAPLTFFGVSFVLAALPAVLGGLAPAAAAAFAADRGSIDASSRFAWLLPAVFGVLFGWLLLYMAAQALLFRATAAALDGYSESFGAQAGVAARVLLPLVGLAILMTLAVWFGMLLLFVPGVMLAIIWSVAAPALVIERTGVFAAMSRSRFLTKGARWRVFGLVVLVYAIYFIASSTLSLAFVGLNGFTGGAAARVKPSIVSTILSIVLQTGFVAVWTAVQGALYIELRNWKDGPVGDRLSAIFA